MSKNFETVFITLRPPRDGDPGVVEEGRFKIIEGQVVLVDINGNQRRDQKGKPIERKLTPADNPRTIAARLVREHMPKRNTNFNRKIIYPDIGKF